MNAGATTDRVLAALRQRLTGPEVRPGDRLDPATLARDLAASATPVREALHSLSGEGLIEARGGGGFTLPFLDETRLRDRYGWSHQVLTLALHGWPRRYALSLPDHGLDPAQPLVERTETLFLAIGRHSLNGEHGRAIQRLNPRLHRVRLAEREILDDGDRELAAIVAAIESGDRGSILRLLAVYHRRRRKVAKHILRLIDSRP